MATKTIASASDIEARWRPLSDAQKTVVAALAGDVYRRLLARIPDLEDRAAADPDGFGADVIQVQANAVIRVLKNPDGKRQESIDDYSWTRDRAISAGELMVLGSEWALLGVNAKRGKAFTINTWPIHGRGVQ